MICNNCGSSNVTYRLDRRNLAEQVCSDCGTVRKIPSAELLELYLEAIKTPTEEKKIPCRYCGERFFLQYGRLGSRYVELDNSYCPMCGRKIRTEE